MSNIYSVGKIVFSTPLLTFKTYIEAYNYWKENNNKERTLKIMMLNANEKWFNIPIVLPRGKK